MHTLSQEFYPSHAINRRLLELVSVTMNSEYAGHWRRIQWWQTDANLAITHDDDWALELRSQAAKPPKQEVRLHYLICLGREEFKAEKRVRRIVSLNCFNELHGEVERERLRERPSVMPLARFDLPHVVFTTLLPSYTININEFCVLWGY